MVLACLKRNPLSRRECPGCWEKRDWVPRARALPERRSIARYGNLKKEFYDNLDALPVGALPVTPPTGKYMYHLRRVPGIGVRIDLRGKIVLKHTNRTMYYRFQSEEDVCQTFLKVAEMANFWEQNPAPPPSRSLAAGLGRL